MRPIREAELVPGSNVSLIAEDVVPVAVAAAVAPGVTATAFPPAEFNGILMDVPALSPPGFTSRRTATSALKSRAIEAHVSPFFTL
jgi:hypothetical protein